MRNEAGRAPTRVRFGDFEADLATRELRRRGLRVRVRDQSFQVLAALVEHPGQLVTRDALRERLWADVFVDVEDGLNTAVSRLREALGDLAGRPRFIETLPKRGYRFIAPVTAIAELPGGQGANTQSVDPRASIEYCRGRQAFTHATPDALSAAEEHFEHAIARDPRFALAYDSLAEVYWWRGYFGYVEPRQAFSRGILHAVRALEIDGGLAEAHALLGQYHKQLHYEWPEVEREMASALDLDPGSAVVRGRYALNFLMPQGRLDEAIRELEHALELDPVQSLTLAFLAITLLLARRYEEAIERSRELLSREPRAFWGHLVLGVAYRQQGRSDEAIAEVRRAVELSDGSSMMTGWLGLTLAVGGHAREARSVLERLQARAASGYVPPSSIAWVYIGLGEIDRAFEWLNRAVDGLDQLIMPIRSYAFLDPLRSDPRFDLLLRRMRLGSG
jgi:DNA-binding winged helix-turn-helix (wHTH) protein